MISRGPLTDELITVLETLGKPVGDATAPEPPFGWSDQPGAIGSRFVPYVVLTPLSSGIPSGPFSDSQADWILPYSVQSFGASRQQCEWMADLARSAIVATTRTTYDLGDGDYKIMQVRTDSIGVVTRQDTVDPGYYAQMDVVSVWVTKENA